MTSSELHCQLMDYCFWYLSRYSTCRGHLERCLKRKVRRLEERDGEQRERSHHEITRVLDRLEALRLLDDHAYCRERIRGLQRKGHSRWSIQSKLRAKGLNVELICEVLAEVSEEEGDLDLQAARHYAKKRKLGPYREGQVEPSTWRDDQMKLARRGFSYRVICEVLER